MFTHLYQAAEAQGAAVASAEHNNEMADKEIYRLQVEIEQLQVSEAAALAAAAESEVEAQAQAQAIQDSQQIPNTQCRNNSHTRI
jgi:hypothetical protein